MAHDNLTAAWHALQARAAQTRTVSLRTLRDGDPARGSRFAHEAAGLYLDFSRQRIDDDGLHLLASLADAAGLRARIEAMWSGELINTTEGRSVLHTALRVPGVSADGPGGEDIARQVLAAPTNLGIRRSVRPGVVAVRVARLSRRCSTSVSAAPISERRWQCRHCIRSP